MCLYHLEKGIANKKIRANKMMLTYGSELSLTGENVDFVGKKNFAWSTKTAINIRLLNVTCLINAVVLIR